MIASSLMPAFDILTTSLLVKATVAPNAVTSAPSMSDPKIAEHFNIFMAIRLTLDHPSYSFDTSCISPLC